MDLILIAIIAMVALGLHAVKLTTATRKENNSILLMEQYETLQEKEFEIIMSMMEFNLEKNAYSEFEIMEAYEQADMEMVVVKTQMLTIKTTLEEMGVNL